MNIALVCIAKNEDNYIDEWLRYHFALGFTHAFVYQNNWRYQGDKSQYSNVEWIEFDGEVKQLPAYNDFIENRADGIDFAAFIDVDEFVCLKKDKSMSDFLSRFQDCYAVGLNWKLFGDSGLKFDGRYSVIDRFTKCQEGFNQHIKTILNMNKCKQRLHFVNPHFVDGAYRCGITVDVDKTRFIHGPWNPNYSTDTAWLNHYHNKTWHEWKQKMARGRADAKMEYVEQSFYEHNCNEVTDTTALDFMQKLQELSK